MRPSGKRCQLVASAALFCATFLMGGCAYLQVPRIDPSGERIFATPPIAVMPQFRNEPGRGLPGDDVEVTLSPQLCVARIGSEVVLSAGVLADDGYLRTNRRLEWSLAPEGVGHFVAVGNNGLVDLLLGDFNRPRKVDNTFAIGSTSRQYVRLDRGTPTTEDDVCVLRGQGWITLTSMSEGTSRVTVLAPSVHSWGCRMQSTVVHWVDAQWRFPPLSINPAGTRHVLTTRISRQSDQSPREGWLVRYEIVDGPPAGFAPDGARTIEVLSDAAGQASAEIFQMEAAPGMNMICISVIRPASCGGGAGQLLVGRGATTKTWSAPDVAVSTTGPAQATVGETVQYNITVSNPGDMPAEEVVVSGELPDGLTYLSSTPEAEQTGRTLTWQLGELGPAQAYTIELICRAAQPGSVSVRADVTAAGGLHASDCAITNVSLTPVPAVVPTPPVSLQVSGPPTAKVGDDVVFEAVITNDSQTAITGLVIKDTFDSGFDHQVEGNSIDRDLPPFEPGQSQRIAIKFRVVKAGELCHTVQIKDRGEVLVEKRVCLTASGGDLVVTPPGQAAVSVDKRGPQTRKVGEIAAFTIDITNIGQQALSKLEVVDRCDPQLAPNQATGGARRTNGDIVWTIDNLAAGETVRLEIQCECKQAAASTCNRVTVTSQEGARAESEACLEVRAAAVAPSGPPKMRLEVAGLQGPIGLGKELTYEVRVTNDSPTPEQSLVLRATLPDGMTLVRLGTTGPGPVKYEVKQRTVTFDPVLQIGAGETITYRLRVLAGRAGKHVVAVELTSQNLSQVLTAEEITEVFQ